MSSGQVRATDRYRQEPGVWLLLVLPALAAALLWAGSTVLPLPATQPVGPPYSVGALRTAVARQPRAWANRTVLVYGTLAGCPYPRPGFCTSWQPRLDDPWADPAAAQTPAIALVWQRPDPVHALLRRLPLLGRLMPPLQVLRWGVPATFRVQIRMGIVGECSTCFEVVALDVE
jgi:hypothetical protein